MDNAHKFLKETWGYTSFRHDQERVIHRLVVDSENALVITRTGGGKSLCFQIPALCFPHITLVISPLIALMKDQVNALVKRNIKAACLDSTLTADEASFIKNEVIEGKMKILYVAPERLNNEGFIHMISQVKISLLAVDEAHCISQWGASFRPEYLKIARFADEMDVERVLCLTATATPGVADDIAKSFYISKEGIFRSPVYRPNLSLKVEVANSLEDKMQRLVPFLEKRTGPSIVYVTLQKQAEDVSNRLKALGLEAEVYHAGLPSEERARVQNSFMDSSAGIVVSTIAFGMGVDKADIRQVVHLYMPKTIENYLQEVGRGGRDDLPTDCLMFLSGEDIPTLEGFCIGDTCNKRDLQLWLQEVALKEPAKDGSLDFNHYQQGRTYDIRSNVLGLLFAELELNYGFIRAITPFYEVYDINPGPDWSQAMNDNSSEAKAIRRFWRSKTTGKYELNVVDAATHSSTDRSDLAKTISSWELKGYCTTKPSQVRARYAVLGKPLPKTIEEIEAVADDLFGRMVKREQESISKLQQVIQFATDDDCLAQNLCSYFGDEDAVPDGICGNCTFCTTGQGVTFKPSVAKEVDKQKVKEILDACAERDDPRLLARFAFGISSPRLQILKLSTYHPLFGCMVTESSFPSILEAFEEECKKVDYQKDEAVAARLQIGSSSSKKRTYSQANSSSSSYSKSGSRANAGTSTRGRGKRTKFYY